VKKRAFEPFFTTKRGKREDGIRVHGFNPPVRKKGRGPKSDAGEGASIYLSVRQRGHAKEKGWKKNNPLKESSRRLITELVYQVRKKKRGARHSRRQGKGLVHLYRTAN